MICNAWYPVNYFKLNFGFNDKLSHNIIAIQQQLNIHIEIKLPELYNNLINSDDRKVNTLIMHFSKMVPYYFLSPWIKGKKQEIIRKSQSFEDNCIYSLNRDEDFYIEIHPQWKEYLINNHKVLLDFCYWNLLQYLQVRNPNTPNIAAKLIKPLDRSSLHKQRIIWDSIIKEMGGIQCIYTGKELLTDEYDIEHFIPWSFVTHDQIWNLIPSDPAINNSKNNRLPRLDKYFKPFVETQFQAIKIINQQNLHNDVIEDYLILGNTIDQIANSSLNTLEAKYAEIIYPLVQIANNSGFEYWNNYDI
jgi:hypothetical protein